MGREWCVSGVERVRESIAGGLLRSEELRMREEMR